MHLYVSLAPETLESYHRRVNFDDVSNSEMAGQHDFEMIFPTTPSINNRLCGRWHLLTGYRYREIFYNT
jgi:hypothetical protein